MEAGQKQQQEKVLELEEIIKQQTKTIQKDMFTAIRRAIGQMKQEKAETSPEVQEVQLAVQKMLQEKADTEKVLALEHQKANKIDTEISLRWVDLLHKMIRQMINLYSMQLKGEVDQTGHESKNQKQNRRVELLH